MTILPNVKLKVVPSLPGSTGAPGPTGPAGVDGADGSLIFCQTSQPATVDTPVGSIWIDTDSTDIDLYTFNGTSWIDTGNNLRGPPGGAAAGSNTQIQFNSGGSFGASANFVYDSGLNAMSVGNIATETLAASSAIFSGRLVTVNNVTITSSTPLIDMAQTWNNGSVAFTGIKSNIFNTSSAQSSLLLDLQVSSVSKFSVDKSGITMMAPLAVASLPTPTSTNVGSRATVNNASQTLTAGIGAVVSGGGSNVVPVFSDGTNWRIG